MLKQKSRHNSVDTVSMKFTHGPDSLCDHFLFRTSPVLSPWRPSGTLNFARPSRNVRNGTFVTTLCQSGDCERSTGFYPCLERISTCDNPIQTGLDHQKCGNVTMETARQLRIDQRAPEPRGWHASHQRTPWVITNIFVDGTTAFLQRAGGTEWSRSFVDFMLMRQAARLSKFEEHSFLYLESLTVTASAPAWRPDLLQYASVTTEASRKILVP
jgi:hypothetical protein